MNTGAAQAGEIVSIGPARADATAVTILLHGRGRSAAEMRDLAVRLNVPSIRFLMPQAPDGTWYPQRFTAPLAENEPALSRSLAACARLVDDLIAEGTEPENIILGGFSQGACLIAEFVVRHPRSYGAVLVFTGGLIGPPETHWPVTPALRGVPVYLTGCTIDEWVPVERVEETARVFEATGARVKLHIFDDRDHHICAEEIRAAHDVLVRWETDDTSGREPRRASH